MTFGGWITFALSTGSVTLLFVWCLWRVLSKKDSSDTSTAFDILEPEDDPERRK